MRPRFLTLLTVPLFCWLAGCQTGEVAKVVPISGGGTITVPLTRDGLKPGAGGGYEVAGSVLEPGKDARDAFYAFGLIAHVEPALRRIQVQDISDETAATLVDDTNPKFEKRLWHIKTDTISADDPRMKWVFQITPSLRVYHFILTRNDGTEISFNHIAMYPPMMKAVMRSRWGEKY